MVTARIVLTSLLAVETPLPRAERGMPPTTWPTRASVSERSMSVKVDDQVDIVELDERHIASERLRLQTLIQRASLGASNAPCVPKASCTFAVYIIRCTEAGKTWEVRRRWTDIRITVDLLRASEGFTSALFTSPAMPSFDAHGPWWRMVWCLTLIS